MVRGSMQYSTDFGTQRDASRDSDKVILKKKIILDSIKHIL